MFLKLFTKQEKTVNLLPQPKEEKLKLNLKKFIITVILFVLILILASFLEYLYKNQKETEEAKLEKQFQQLEKGDRPKVQPIIDQLNGIKIKISNYQNFVQQYPPVLPKLLAIEETVPQTVKLKSLNIDNGSKVSISAIAKDPSSANLFLKALQNKSDSFSNVLLSSIARSGEDSYSFSMNFNFK